jgi:hypothetical protein
MGLKKKKNRNKIKYSSTQYYFDIGWYLPRLRVYLIIKQNNEIEKMSKSYVNINKIVFTNKIIITAIL